MPLAPVKDLVKLKRGLTTKEAEKVIRNKRISDILRIISRRIGRDRSRQGKTKAELIPYLRKPCRVVKRKPVAKTTKRSKRKSAKRGKRSRRRRVRSAPSKG